MSGPAEILGEMLATSERALAFTGAGISTESGIPDFRGPNGVWTKFDPNEFNFQNYVADPDHRRRVWKMRLESWDTQYEPNDGHRALADLERLGIIDCVVTQNIDRLHQAAGSTVVLELHGNAREVVCLSCGARQPASAAHDRVRAGEDDPACLLCGGILKSATISFGQPMPEDIVEEAFYRARQCDLCLVVGSSLVVYPAAGVPLEAKHAGARLVILNQSETEMDGLADLVINEPAGAVLSEAARIAARLRAR